MDNPRIRDPQRWIEEWSRYLNIRKRVVTRRIPFWHVTGPEGRPGCSLVGIVLDEHEPCIYHTRRLREDDIVHELLHVAFPDWSEDRVNAHTERLLRSKRERRLPVRITSPLAGVVDTA